MVALAQLFKTRRQIPRAQPLTELKFTVILPMWTDYQSHFTTAYNHKGYGLSTTKGRY